MTTARTVALRAVLATALAGFIAAAGYGLGRHTAASSVAAATAAAAAPAGSTPEGRRVLYWHDPMVPGQRFGKPGKSPFMDMQLVPVYADEAGDAGDPGKGGDAGIRINPSVQQNLGIRTATVKRVATPSAFDTVGTVQFDERLSVAVQTRVAGYVERLAVRAPMEQVRKGQVLATVYAPDWLGPQNELLALQRSGAPQELVDAARERMRAMSIPEALIRQSEASGTAQARYPLVAPIAGVVAELGVREGVAVAPGTTLFRIAGLAKVWAVAEVPEAQASGLARGRQVRAVLQTDAARSFNGELTEIVPQVSAATRTLQARFEVDNPSGTLLPGMLLRLQVAGPDQTRLVVPAEAVIRTGVRTVVMVRRAGGGFEPRKVQLGADLGDLVEVVKGLAEGDEVVASGQFLLDSESRLKSGPDEMATSPSASASAAARLATGPTAPASPASAAMGARTASPPSGRSAPGVAAPTPALGTAPTAPPVALIHRGQGKVDSVDAAGITISHGPIVSLQWPAMTMAFAKATPTAFAEIDPGDTVRFAFRQGGPTGYQLVSVQRIDAGKGAGK